jgi:hypothetical protein
MASFDKQLRLGKGRMISEQRSSCAGNMKGSIEIGDHGLIGMPIAFNCLVLRAEKALSHRWGLLGVSGRIVEHAK